jgi:hypothetical protein
VNQLNNWSGRVAQIVKLEVVWWTGSSITCSREPVVCLFLAGVEASGGGSLARCVHEVVRVAAPASPTSLSLHN